MKKTIFSLIILIILITSTVTISIIKNKIKNSEEQSVYTETINIAGANDITINETIKLTAIVLPKNMAIIVTWQSSDTNIATISDNGMLTGISEGKVTITATTATGRKAKTEVTVKSFK